MLLNQDFFSHSLGIAIVVWKLTDHASLLLQYAAGVHATNSIVLFSPILCRFKSLFIDESGSV